MSLGICNSRLTFFTCIPSLCTSFIYLFVCFFVCFVYETHVRLCWYFFLMPSMSDLSDLPGFTQIFTQFGSINHEMYTSFSELSNCIFRVVSQLSCISGCLYLRVGHYDIHHNKLGRIPKHTGGWLHRVFK